MKIIVKGFVSHTNHYILEIQICSFFSLRSNFRSCLWKSQIRCVQLCAQVKFLWEKKKPKKIKLLELNSLPRNKFQADPFQKANLVGFCNAKNQVFKNWGLLWIFFFYSTHYWMSHMGNTFTIDCLSVCMNRYIVNHSVVIFWRYLN